MFGNRESVGGGSAVSGAAASSRAVFSVWNRQRNHVLQVHYQRGFGIVVEGDDIYCAVGIGDAGGVVVNSFNLRVGLPCRLVCGVLGVDDGHKVVFLLLFFSIEPQSARAEILTGGKIRRSSISKAILIVIEIFTGEGISLTIIVHAVVNSKRAWVLYLLDEYLDIRRC